MKCIGNGSVFQGKKACQHTSGPGLNTYLAGEGGGEPKDMGRGRNKVDGFRFIFNHLCENEGKRKCFLPLPLFSSCPNRPLGWQHSVLPLPRTVLKFEHGQMQGNGPELWPQPQRGRLGIAHLGWALTTHSEWLLYSKKPKRRYIPSGTQHCHLGPWDSGRDSPWLLKIRLTLQMH